MKNQTEFWVSNVSDRNVTLRDLAISIKARSHVNLMDSRHYSYELEQLEKSAESGSLHAKRHLLRVRKVPPPDSIVPGIYKSKKPMFLANNPLMSRLVLEEPKYEEFQISETDFINELTDIDDE